MDISNLDNLLRLRAFLDDQLATAASSSRSADEGNPTVPQAQMPQMANLTNQPLGSNVTSTALPPPSSSSRIATQSSAYPAPMASQVGDVPVTHAHPSAPITPYQRVRTMGSGLPTAPRGHPSTPMVPNPVASQSFFGLENFGHNMRRQVNQQRLASSSSSRSSTTRQARSAHRGRGPAIHPPTLPRVTTAKIEDCLSGFQDNHGVPLLRVKVKVYPPKVCNFNFARHDDLQLIQYTDTY